MENSRTKNSIRIMLSGGTRQILTIVLTFVSRTVFIRTLGAEYLGLNGLFSNILSLLALSELGIGTAIAFYLYKPIADNNIPRIQSLMAFYKLCYRMVGFVIIGLGLCLVPFLSKIVNFDQAVPVNLYLVYSLYLLNTGSSYLFFAYKQAILDANQQQYKVENINSVFAVINCLADIVVLIIFRNYIIYLIVKLLLTLIKNVVISIRVNREYPYLKEKPAKKLTRTEIKSFFKDLSQVSIFKIGSQFLNATANIIISIMLGTVIVGYYSNYYMIILQVMTVYLVILRSFTAGIGNVVATETQEKQYSVYKKLNFINFVTCVFCSVCLSQLLNSFMRLWVGGIDENYVFSQIVVIILVINFYFDTSCQILNTFREASGNFQTGYWLQLIAGGVNIIMAIFLGKWLGLAGIFLATILSKLCITIIPFVNGVSKDVFGMKGNMFIFEYLKQFGFMLFCMVITWICSYKLHYTNFVGFIFECLITIIVPILIICIFYRKNPNFIEVKSRVINVIKGFYGKATFRQ